jgi:hypothetical protein
VSTYLALSGAPGQLPRPRKASAKHHLSQPPPPPLPNTFKQTPPKPTVPNHNAPPPPQLPPHRVNPPTHDANRTALEPTKPPLTAPKPTTPCHLLLVKNPSTTTLIPAPHQTSTHQTSTKQPPKPQLLVTSSLSKTSPESENKPHTGQPPKHLNTGPKITRSGPATPSPNTQKRHNPKRVDRNRRQPNPPTTTLQTPVT